MQPLRLALAPNGPKRLEVAWRGRWKDLTLTLDGAPVLTVPTEAELKAGREVRTQAGTLAVQLKTPAFGRELWLTLDGRPIPQTAADPAKRLQQSYGVLYLVAGLSVALGAAATVFEVGPLADMGFGWLSIAFGTVIALLAPLDQIVEQRARHLRPEVAADVQIRLEPAGSGFRREAQHVTRPTRNPVIHIGAEVQPPRLRPGALLHL